MSGTVGRRFPVNVSFFLSSLRGDVAINVNVSYSAEFITIKL